MKRQADYERHLTFQVPYWHGDTIVLFKCPPEHTVGPLMTRHREKKKQFRETLQYII